MLFYYVCFWLYVYIFCIFYICIAFATLQVLFVVVVVDAFVFWCAYVVFNVCLCLCWLFVFMFGRVFVFFFCLFACCFADCFCFPIYLHLSCRPAVLMCFMYLRLCFIICICFIAYVLHLFMMLYFGYVCIFWLIRRPSKGRASRAMGLSPLLQSIPFDHI